MPQFRTTSIAAASAALFLAAAAHADSYRVYPVPVSSPDYGERVVVGNPADSNASPFGWHDSNGVAGPEFTILRGNNVHVYVDANADGSPDDVGPDGGVTLNFDFPWSPVQAPGTYAAALATNAFYWGNRLHDIFYAHGFTEAARNMQTNNYGRGGIGNDPLRIEILHGGSVDNITWVSSEEGGSPSLRNHVWTITDPAREASFDASAMIYGYSKIIESRLNAPGCFSNADNPSSGYADFLAILLTSDFTLMDARMPRAIGTYLMGQTVTGNGIRPKPYSTLFTVNNDTYADTTTLSTPDGVGMVWAAALWDLTWRMVGAYGASNDWYNGNGAENRMLRLVIRAQQLQPCSAGFIEARNALIAADEELHAGANACLISKAFARRGLGFSATQGSADDNSDNVAQFDTAPDCDKLFADGFEA